MQVFPRVEYKSFNESPNIFNPLLSAAPLNTLQTFAIPSSKLLGFNVMVLWVRYVHANNGNITFSFTGARPYAGDTNDYIPQTIAVAAGVGTLSNQTFVKAVTGNINFYFPLSIVGPGGVDFTVSHSAGNASDTITVNADLYSTSGA